MGHWLDPSPVRGSVNMEVEFRQRKAVFGAPSCIDAGNRQGSVRSVFVHWDH